MATVRYRERLVVPLRWWLLAAGFVLSVWVAYAAAVDPWGAALVGLLVAAAASALLVGYGRALVVVTDEAFVAGRARLPLEVVGDVAALDRAQARRVSGPDADARAYLLLRPYVGAAVRVAVDDPDDPAPYWLVSSRDPARLAAALAAARDAARA